MVPRELKDMKFPEEIACLDQGDATEQGNLGLGGEIGKAGDTATCNRQVTGYFSQQGLAEEEQRGPKEAYCSQRRGNNPPGHRAVTNSSGICQQKGQGRNRHQDAFDADVGQ